ncbi:YhjD/YihY/BrkB family envelope integrity protein [Nocardioides ochotonae]|uniref:YhjD/YihY/BrkB family envelope integrity protein n=1 Tax=Nocardioides ochotonae TaxID=2685869 RepID=UPI00140D7A94|nr:YhjD/YihY/BrkB family envelope integrity protein [Nocardioides ochotonae]
MGATRAGADAGLTPEDGRPPGSAEAAAYAAIDRLPGWLQRPILRLLAGWPGRIVFRSVATCLQLEIFDRAMSIAAQIFTSVFPILILLTTWAGSADTVADALDLPQESRSLLDQAVAPPGGGGFGVLGVVFLLASATSLSRALTRAFAVAWEVPRPRSSWRAAWRWLAVVVAMALSLVVVRALSGFAAAVPPGAVWQRMVAFACDLSLMTYVPWLLLTGAVPLRRLLPGAAIFAALMLAARPASALWLPRALEVSADRYGSIGVAFTYLAWLYAVAFGMLLATAVGRAVAVDRGRVGRRIRGEPDAGATLEVEEG